MKVERFLAVLALVVLTLCGTVAYAADPEPPLSWEGEGEVTMIGQGDTREMDFDITLEVDKEGMVSGNTSTDEGKAQIERLYYGEAVKTEMPQLESRQMILVLSLRSTDTPMVVIMTGQVLSGRFAYGELRIGRLNDSDIKTGLDIGNKLATPLEGSSLPSGVKKALEKTAPIGCFQMTGKFVEEK